jgi:hypothetical protein
MIGSGDYSPALNQILTQALEKLSVLDGLTIQEVAARCVLVGTVPTFPAFSAEVVAAYAKLEAEQIRGGDTWQTEDALAGRR